MYKLSNLAAEDFAAIYEYTLLNFGVGQAPRCQDSCRLIGFTQIQSRGRYE